LRPPRRGSKKDSALGLCFSGRFNLNHRYAAAGMALLLLRSGS
jgi:hypothetical protein